MLNAEEAQQAGCPMAAGRNGSASEPAGAERPVWEYPRVPGPASWEGLPPGPRMPLMFQQLAWWYRRTPFFERCRARYGSPFTIQMRMPAQPFVVICKPDQLKQMFHAPPDVLWAGDGSSELFKWFGWPGLTYYEEDEHLTRRKLINRSTHGEAMEQIAASAAEVIERELSSWPRGEPLELFPRFRHLAVSVVRHVNFGPAPDERLDELVDLVSDMMAPADNPVSLVEEQYLPPIVHRLLGAYGPYRRLIENRGRIDEILYQVIDERRRAGGGDGQDTLSVLLAAENEDGSPISSLEIRNELMTNFVAGSATTSAGMAWSIDHVARDDRVRRRLVDEIETGEDDAYLTATVQEVLRRRPPLPFAIPRLVVKPFQLDGWRLPPGVRIWANGHLVHHDPEIYPDPYAFRPERFLESKPTPTTWMPFGGGRRACLGKGIAELEMKAVLRAVFQRFDVRPAGPEPELRRSFLAVNRPSRGARVVLSERAPETAPRERAYSASAA